MQKLELLFDGKVFYPQGPVTLEPNTYCVVAIEKTEKLEANRTLKKIIDRGKIFGINDIAQQHDHYLYKTEKD